MEDDEDGPLDMTGSDILPPLAHSTNPLFPNAIVKKPPNNAKTVGKSSKATSDEKKEEKEAKKAAAPVAQPAVKPYVGKNGPVSSHAPVDVLKLTIRPQRRDCPHGQDGVWRLVMPVRKWRRLGVWWSSARRFPRMRPSSQKMIEWTKTRS